MINAAGAAVTRRTRDGLEVAVVHRPRYADWSLPKGKPLSSESAPACAVREVAEETGLSVRLGAPLDTVEYQAGEDSKRVDFWRATVTDTGPFRPGDEIDELGWWEVSDAAARLSYPQDRFLIEQLAEVPETVPLIIVRHAKAVSRQEWSKADLARPIAPAGQEQARLLVPLLSAYGVERLISSAAIRCVSTVQPYAVERHLEIVQVPELTEEQGGNDPDGVGAVVAQLARQAVADRAPAALCCHRPVLPHILSALELPERTLRTAELIVAHLRTDEDPDPVVWAVELHRV